MAKSPKAKPAKNPDIPAPMAVIPAATPSAPVTPLVAPRPTPIAKIPAILAPSISIGNPLITLAKPSTAFFTAGKSKSKYPAFAPAPKRESPNAKPPKKPGIAAPNSEKPNAVPVALPFIPPKAAIPINPARAIRPSFGIEVIISEKPIAALLILSNLKSAFKASKPYSPACRPPKKAGMAIPRAAIPAPAPIKAPPIPPRRAPLPNPPPPLPPTLDIAVFLSIFFNDSLMSWNIDFCSRLFSNP